MCSGTSSVANVSSLAYNVLGALREACQSPVEDRSRSLWNIGIWGETQAEIGAENRGVGNVSCVCVYPGASLVFYTVVRKSVLINLKNVVTLRRAPSTCLISVVVREFVLTPSSTFSITTVPASLPDTPVSVLYICRSLCLGCLLPDLRVSLASVGFHM